MQEFMNEITKETPTQAWVRIFAELSRQQRIEAKECACGNDCSNDEFNSLGFFGEYICGECR